MNSNLLEHGIIYVVLAPKNKTEATLEDAPWLRGPSLKKTKLTSEYAHSENTWKMARILPYENFFKKKKKKGYKIYLEIKSDRSYYCRVDRN
jgi:hypothetical protein